jgi:membrane protease YdiL (CAAX protease family)
VKEENQISLEDASLGWGFCFEVGLGLLALLFGQLTSVWPAETLWPVSLTSIVIGIGSALPPLLIVVGLRRVGWGPFRRLTNLVDEKLVPMFRGMSLLDLALLSFAAGWGEELLFRGLIQGEIAYHTNVVVGVAVASVAFGLVHFLSLTYFIMALVVSVYFGWLYWQFGTLWVPILGHAVYDFLMLWQLQRMDEAKTAEATMESDVSSTTHLD